MKATANESTSPRDAHVESRRFSRAHPEPTGAAPAPRKGPGDQPMRAANIAAIASYFASGAKEAIGDVGIELEHTLVRADGSAVPYTGEEGIARMLEQLAQEYPEETRDAEGDLLGVARPGEAVTLEPAAQIELSAGPFARLSDARAAFRAFEQLLARVAASCNARALAIGYHPTAHATELSLIPKKRYKFMSMYFGEIGPWGARMMRGSASTQVSIDYTSETDCLRKLRTALRIAPLLALMADNAPRLEGAPRPHELVRTAIWNGCDPDRCGVIPGALDEGFSWERYAQEVLDTPAILVPCRRGEWCYSEHSFGDFYANDAMSRADVEHALSMQFTDVRLKTYIELRPADALPVDYAIAYAALAKGLLLNDAALATTEELVDGVGEDDIARAKSTLMKRGYEALIYGRPAASLADALIETASSGLANDERPLLAPLARLVERRTTLARIACAGGPEAARIASDPLASPTQIENLGA